MRRELDGYFWVDDTSDNRVRGRLTWSPEEGGDLLLEGFRRTVYLWFSDELVKREMARKLAHVDELIAQRMAANAMVAMDALRDALEQPVEGAMSYELKLRIICEILDRVPYTAKETVLARSAERGSTGDIAEQWGRLRAMWQSSPEWRARNGAPVPDAR